MSAEVTHPGSRSCVHCRRKWLSGRPWGKAAGVYSSAVGGLGKRLWTGQRGWTVWNGVYDLCEESMKITNRDPVA